MSEPTPRTDVLLREGEAQYFDNGGALSVEQRDKLFTLAIDLCAQLECTLAAQRTALLALFAEAERNGSQGIAVRGREILK